MIRLIVITLLILPLMSFAGEEPKIVRQGKTTTVVINDDIKATLKKWDAKATILNSDNFSDEVWGLYTKNDPDSLPMATVGDFNGDGKNDIGLLVKTGNELKAIAALSQKEGHSIHEVKKFSLNDQSIIEQKASKEKTLKIKIYLFTEKKERLKHSKGMALRDGFQIEQLYSPNTTVHYAKNGQFLEYKGLVK